MSNKDVKVECEYYTGTMRYNCNLFCNEVGNNRNCQDYDCAIKQLQRKEEENNRLREALEETKNYIIACEYGLDTKKLINFITQAIKVE